MIVAYSENCDRQNIEMYLEKRLYEEPVVYSNNKVRLVKKKEKYEIHLFAPTNYSRNSGFTRKWRMYFRDNDIFLRERITPGSMLAVFLVVVTGVTACGTLTTGDYSLSVVLLVCFALFFGVFYVLHPKFIKKFLNEKME